MKTDEERVAFALRLPSVQENIIIKQTASTKSSSTAASLRNEGNTYFQKRQLGRALEVYTQSILVAPSTDLKVLSLAYANRSAVLFHMKEYELCLRDIEFAQKMKYPGEMVYKILDRKARSLKALCRIEESKKVFEEAIVSSKTSKLKRKDRESWVKQVEKQISECSNQTENLMKSVTHLEEARSGFSTPVQNYGLHEKFVSISKALDIKYTEEKGRHTIAARDINIGDVLLVEKPFASVLLQEQSKSHCHQCFVHILAPLPCSYCTTVRYCSEKCAKESWDAYHYAECMNLEHVYVAGKYGHLALRVVVKAGFQYLKASVKQFESEEKKCDPAELGCNPDGVYDPSDYRPIYHLVGHTHERTLNDLFVRTLNAIYLLRCLEGTEYYGDSTKLPSREDQAFIGGLLLRHLQSLPCNAHEISELQLSLKSVATSEAAEIGAGIYGTLSLFNHSCEPNVTRFFYGDKCVVRAFSSIPCRGEVVDNYGILSALTPRKQRQESLQSQYYFKCNCHACLEDSPLYSELIKQDVPQLKCANCRMALAGEILTDGKLVKCEKCGVPQSLEDKANLLRKSEVEYNEAMTKLLGEADVSSALPRLEGHLRVLEECVCMPWQGFNSTQELMKQGYNMLANCHLIE
ncbi:predicted protein [Nematostella vectensis]|uniref:Protein-lysine N-methyltransferase SMYD4 n=1 Tax=Nematostella vectensis TaxID=45351 RepID=A7SWX2_NEMVE|nr:predicted protein [Nematostella vectensis]|eukprot:XP_001623892.1 predicted protein [Nematostella vectensis]